MNIIKINKSLAIFVSLALILGVLSSVILYKFFPLIIHKTIYYCQEVLIPFFWRFPQQLSLISLIIFIGILFIISLKLVIVFFHVRQTRKNLISQTKSSSRFLILLKKINLEKHTLLIENKKPFAFCFGIIHPKIYISTTMLEITNEKEIIAILLHEKYHLENRDALTMLFASVIKILFLFFPLLSDLLRNYRIEREIKADQAAIRALGDNAAIVSALKKLISKQQFSFVSAPAIAEHDTLESRINAIVKKDFYFYKFKIHNILISLFSIIILAGVIVLPVHAVEIRDSKMDGYMFCLNGDNSCTMTCKEASSKKSLPITSVDNASHPYTPMQ